MISGQRRGILILFIYHIQRARNLAECHQRYSQNSANVSLPSNISKKQFSLRPPILSIHAVKPPASTLKHGWGAGRETSQPQSFCPVPFECHWHLP